MTKGMMGWDGTWRIIRACGFFFFIFFKNKNFKNICPFWNISKISPGRPPIGRQAFSVIFFFKFATRSLEKKGACRPANGRQGAVAPPSGDQWAGLPSGTAGACRPPPSGDRGSTPYIRIRPPIPSSFQPENSSTNPVKKREVRKREATKSCRIQHLWSTG